MQHKEKNTFVFWGISLLLHASAILWVNSFGGDRGEPEIRISVSLSGSQFSSTKKRALSKIKHARQTSKPKANNNLSQTQRRFDSSEVEALNYDMQNQIRYPQNAIIMGWEGKVVLELAINIHGRVQIVKIIRSSSYDVLDNAALEVVKSWKYPKGNPKERIQLIFLFMLR